MVGRRSRSGLAATVGPEGLLLLRWRRARRSVGLLFTPHRLVALAQGGQSVDLLWSAHERGQSMVDRRSGSSWRVCYWSSKRAGIGVQLEGALARAAERLQPAVTIWWQPDFGDGCRLAVTTAIRSARAEHDTLQALTSVLAHRPDMRARLADPHTVGRLAADLAAGMRERPADRVPTFSVGDLDVALALYRCGLVFEYGRPLPGEVVPLDDALWRVESALETMPLRGRRRPEPATIERVVRRRYLDVAPWPFAALLDGR